MRVRALQLSVRILVFVLGLMMAVPASGLGQLLFFCTMTGQVGPRCCCQPEVREETEAGPKVSSAPCCEVVRAEQPVPQVRAHVEAVQIEPPIVVTMTTPFRARARVHGPIASLLHWGPRGPPFDTGPPLFAKHCSFLI